MGRATLLGGVIGERTSSQRAFSLFGTARPGYCSAMASEAMMWKGVGLATGFAAGALTRKLLQGVWQATTGSDPPGNTAAPNTTWRAALIWAASSGIALGVTRIVAQRGAAEVWRAAKGHYPEGLEEAA